MQSNGNYYSKIANTTRSNGDMFRKTKFNKVDVWQLTSSILVQNDFKIPVKEFELFSKVARHIAKRFRSFSAVYFISETILKHLL